LACSFFVPHAQDFARFGGRQRRFLKKGIF